MAFRDKSKPVAGAAAEKSGPVRVSKRDGAGAAAPTMIIPQGTEITVDAHGQLSIHAPGNLVLQNSGSYGTLASRSGSIRIETDVEVEAVSVECAEACYVQGSLTAWKVEARSLQIEETGRAYIMLQETEELAVGREARLVGNFSSEKELFLLFSRFADQVRSLPFFPDRGASRGELAGDEGAEAVPPRAIRPAADQAAEAGDDGAGPPKEFPEPLYFALVLLEREADRKSYGPTSQRVIEELVKLLRERDLATLEHTHRTLFGRIVEPREDVQRARELVEQHYGAA